jgi:hypothetical protein
MNKLILIMITLLLLISIKSMAQSQTQEFMEVQRLALKNHVKASNRTVMAILNASRAYSINPLQLTAIGILESNLDNTAIHLNKDGTRDISAFQINEKNLGKCLEYNLNTIEGSAMCASKLLAIIRFNFKRDDSWVGRYHSSTPKKKRLYLDKLSKVVFALKESNP